MVKKTFSKLRIKEDFLNLIEGIYEKLTFDTAFNVEKLFPPKNGNKAKIFFPQHSY